MEVKPLGRTGVKIPELGLGTWKMRGLDDELQALSLGIDLGMKLIDTAETYGTEKLVNRAVNHHNDAVFVATKVSGSHLRYDDVLRACESSLRNLNMKCIDLYQVHWPNHKVPVSETMRAMEKLVKSGKINYIGVSNFSVEETKEAVQSLSKYELASNQVEYSLLDRTIERDLLPFCEREKITVIAYSPLGQGAIAKLQSHKTIELDRVAKKYQKTRCQVALNYVTASPMVIAIPKASNPNHVKENAGASDWRLRADDMALLNRAFPTPS